MNELLEVRKATMGPGRWFLEKELPRRTDVGRRLDAANRVLRESGPGRLDALKRRRGAIGLGAGSFTAGAGVGTVATRRRQAGRGGDGVSKMGEWKTIEQRERSAAKARKTQRRGWAGVSAGGGAAAYAVGRTGGGAIGQARTLTRDRHLFGNQAVVNQVGGKAKLAARLVRSRPYGATVLAGGALAGAGGLGVAQGKARESYHQSKINQRRKGNAKRTVSKSEPTFGMGSGGVGRRMTSTMDVEISKRVRNKDHESDRQRRLGMAQAGLTGGAGLTGYATGKEVREVTRAVRGQKGSARPGGAALRFYGGSTGRKLLHGEPVPNSARSIKPGFAVSRKAGKLGAATLALGAAAGATNSYARGERNRRWE